MHGRDRSESALASRAERRHCALRRAGRGARYHGRPAARDSDLVQGWYELAE